MAGYLPPYVEILEQPAPRSHRFRYEREVEGRSAGAIVGVHSTAEAKTYPKIKVMNYRGPYCVVVSCVTDDPPYRPHPHKLVGKNCNDGIFTARVDDPDMTYSFTSLGVQCAKKSDVESNLKERKRRKMDPFRTGFSNMRDVNLSVLRLCFQVFIPQADKSYAVLPPIVSETIRDQRTVSSLTITKLSHFSAPAVGGTDIIILCERILGDDVEIWFYETQNSRVVWEVKAVFMPSDVHKQGAISFKVPRYHNVNIRDPVQVSIQLRRSFDTQERGAPRDFYFTSRQNDISDILPRKLRKVLKFIERNKKFLDPGASNIEAPRSPGEVVYRIAVPRTISQRNMQYEDFSNAVGNPFSPATTSLNITTESRPVASSCASFVFPVQSRSFSAQSKNKRKSQEFSGASSSPFSPASTSFHLTSESQPISSSSTSFVFPDQSTDCAPPQNKRKSQEYSDAARNPFSSASSKFNRNSLDLSSVMGDAFHPVPSSSNLTSRNETAPRLSTSFESSRHSAGFDMPPEVYRESFEPSPAASNSSLNITSNAEPIAGEATSEPAWESKCFDMTLQTVYRHLLGNFFLPLPAELSAAENNAFPPASTSLTSQMEPAATPSISFERFFHMPPEEYCQALGLFTTESNYFSQAPTSQVGNSILNSMPPTEHIAGSSITSSIHASTVMSPYTHRCLDTFSTVASPMTHHQQLAETSEGNYANETYTDENDLSSILLDSFSSITLDYE